MTESTHDVAEQPARTEIEVRVGTRKIIVGRFKGYKATKLMREAAQLARHYPKVGKQIATYKRDYAAENMIELDRAEAEYRLGDQARQISDKAWDSAGGKIRLGRTPTTEEQIVAVFPDLLEEAEDRVIRVLALVGASNEDLRRAWDEGGDEAVDKLLEEQGAELLFEADAGELVELALAATEVGRAQFAPLRQRLASLGEQLGLTPAPMPATETEDAPEPTTTATEPAASPTSPPSSETTQSSSTDSPRPTDGQPARPSLESPGSRSERSPTG